LFAALKPDQKIACIYLFIGLGLLFTSLSQQYSIGLRMGIKGTEIQILLSPNIIYILARLPQHKCCYLV